VICGGFPCQDVSGASRGRGGGITGQKSGLWKEYARIVEEIEPTIVVVENVALGATRWLPTVRRDLHMLGYRTRALRIDASDVGAPHSRPRIFVVGYANANGQSTLPIHGEVAGMQAPARLGGNWRLPVPRSLRMAHGVPGELDRVHALGDAVIPDCAEIVGRVIMKSLAPTSLLTKASIL
jgi:DNA (cytosine-5)-methyltransferase 1